MKVLFVMLAIEVKNDMYLRASKALISNIISLTPHDVLVTTNNAGFFSDVQSDRVKIRNIIPPDLILSYTAEYNYNTKYIAFKDLPVDYDVIFYLDCDVQLTHWTEKSDAFLERLIASHEFGATRLNAYLGVSIDEHLREGRSLFSHKIVSYGLESLDKESALRQARLPSEHFLIFKNVPDKIRMFFESWQHQNSILQSKLGSRGSWGDGFEIGIAVHNAGFSNICDINHGDSVTILGVMFNGNKR